jgi:hypothetical protein
MGGARGPHAIQQVVSIAWARVHSLVLLAVALALILGVLPAALVAAGTWVAQAPGAHATLRNAEVLPIGRMSRDLQATTHQRPQPGQEIEMNTRSGGVGIIGVIVIVVIVLFVLGVIKL